MFEAFINENDKFRPFSIDHLVIVLIGTGLGAALIWFARRSDEQTKVRIGAIMGYIIGVTYFVVFISIDAMRFGFDPAKHFPFAMCNVCGVTIWLVLHKKNYLAYEILFFWIMSGTLAAVVTPENKQCFPHYTYFAFWTIHLGLVIAAIYATLVYKMRPTFRSVIKSIVILHLYAAVVGVINWLLSPYEANYFYLCRKPDVWTPLNMFGPWPWYILGAQVFAFSVFLVIYFPFWIERMFFMSKKNEREEKEPAERVTVETPEENDSYGKESEEKNRTKTLHDEA